MLRFVFWNSPPFSFIQLLLFYASDLLSYFSQRYEIVNGLVEVDGTKTEEAMAIEGEDEEGEGLLLFILFMSPPFFVCLHVYGI